MCEFRTHRDCWAIGSRTAVHDLVVWLREQIAADEERTRTGHPFNNGRVYDQDDYWVEPNGEAWHTSTCGWRVGEGLDRDCECRVPADVLAQCEAHTGLLDLIVLVLGADRRADAVRHQMLRALALAYQHNPGYQERWRA